MVFMFSKISNFVLFARQDIRLGVLYIVICLGEFSTTNLLSGTGGGTGLFCCMAHGTLPGGIRTEWGRVLNRNLGRVRPTQ